MAETVLITGAAGFIGSHVAEAMADQGWRVGGLDNFDPFYPRRLKDENAASLRARNVEVIEGDITQADDVRRAFSAVRPDVVIHLAACAGVRPSIQDPARYARVNVEGTQRILDEAARRGVERLVVASSSSVYGNNPKVPFAETDDVSRPISPYAATKVATELICRTASHLHGLKIAALRFFTVYGPRQRPDLAIRKFMTLIARGEPIPVFGDGAMSRDFTFIDDIVEGVIRATERLGQVEPFRVYNLGSDSPVRLADLVEAIQETVGREAIIDRRSEQPGDVSRTWADLTRSRAELDYAPKVRLQDGLNRQWQWLRGQVDQG